MLITHEVLHYLKSSKAEKYYSMAIKTDMSKAYDKLEWEFIRMVLEKMNFHHTLINHLDHAMHYVGELYFHYKWCS